MSPEIIIPHADYRPQFTQIWERLQQSAVPGPIAEFGVYRGGSSIFLHELTGREVWAFDTFTGIPEQDYDPSIDRDLPGTFHDKEAFLRLCLHPGVIPLKGRFEDTLPHWPKSPNWPEDFKDGKFSFVYLDADLHSSTSYVLDWLPAHLSPGAAILADDYHTHPGVRLALNTFCASQVSHISEIYSTGSNGLVIYGWH